MHPPGAAHGDADRRPHDHHRRHAGAARRHRHQAQDLRRRPVAAPHPHSSARNDPPFEAGSFVSEDPMTTTFHSHWRDLPESTWRWPNFSPAEIACRGTGKLLINEPALDKLQALRDRLGKPLIVRSAYRSPEHNRSVGGATRSKHMDGAAFDIAMANHDPVAFEAAARDVGFF